MEARADAALVYEYRKTGEAPGMESQCGGSWQFFMRVGKRFGQQLTLTETEWVSLGKPERITITVENGDEEEAA